MRARGLSLMLVLWLGAPAGSASQTDTHTLVGLLVRVDLPRGSVWLRTPAASREIELRVDAERTRITQQGRPRRLEELRPGERALALCADEAEGRHVALRLKLGASRSSVGTR